MRRSPSWRERAAAQALPESAREQVVADLREEARACGPRAGPGWVARQTLLVAARYHAECYRETGDAWKATCLLAAGFGFLFIVPAAATTLLAGAAVFKAPLAQAIGVMSQASHLVAAAAAGLLLGRTTLLAEHLGIARWHVAAVLAVSAVAKDGGSSGALAAAVLMGAMGLACLNRREARRREPAASR